MHEVVRHVRDVCRLHVAGLDGVGRSPLEEPFDARRTPQEWLRPSVGEAPEQTVRDLRSLGAREAAALDTRPAECGPAVVAGPYGPVHWTTLTTHVLWDTWLHERDAHAQVAATTPTEEAVVAMYAILIASVPALLKGHDFRAEVVLVGGKGQAYSASVGPGEGSLRTGDSAGEEALRGELPLVVDALSGRGPEVAEVLLGDPGVREPLTWLRPVLAGPG